MIKILDKNSLCDVNIIDQDTLVSVWMSINSEYFLFCKICI